ncbi:SMP-30/gluconolactonase/LRE family protein [Sphingomonas sp.]|uniref:SMP-30/gluconolactonase/LRE family protein n=1 Tax=Sphingomonas sp. TaxID=28214 RepID=UPI00286E11C0|nr:SMP-30/gluconolactonase/LRE family protein [Sphingomonas sp.]
MPAEPPMTCVADVAAVLGEGPVWVKREAALYWVDIKGRKIFRLDAVGAVTAWDTPLRVGSIAPRAGGGFIAGTDHGFATFDAETGRLDLLFDPEPERPDNRFNDGKVDRAGRFWAGTMDDTERAASGALYRLDATDAATRVDDGYRVTNGPAFSPDGGQMYHNDSARQVTFAFDLAPDGSVSNRREFARFGEGDGYPDGMTVDAEGCLWIAFWDGWCVRRFSPAGELLATLKVPAQRPTSCAFGGPALDRLYISSARIGLDAAALIDQPHAGGLFLADPGVRGLADLPYAG